MVVGLTERVEQYFILNVFGYQISLPALLGDRAAILSFSIDLWAFF